MAVLSFKAAQELTKEKIEAEVIDLRRPNPLDVKKRLLLRSKRPDERRGGRRWKTGGVGGEIVSLIMENAF